MIDNKILKVTAVALVTVFWMSISADACFPSKYWISCLINTCKLGGRCPGDPTAKCKMEKTECNGCKPQWYTSTGEIASCGVKRDLKLCPGGEPVVHCKIDSCKWPCSHPDFKRAKCRQSYCGECAAEYQLKGKWVKCPVSSSGKKAHSEMLPIDTVLGDSCIKVQCAIDVCIGQRCPGAPNAVCRPNRCNECKAAWFLNNRPVDCQTGELILDQPAPSPTLPSWQRTCAPGVSATPCDMKVCESKICRNFPNAQCRPDGCGGCKDTWYVENKLVDCLSDECPPKVPIVKCVDDPCKYFGHYCPAAECRASQCGKCEAKFFANGQEIDCAMPPKECKMGVQPLNCPWYTCPANICPSDRRLMCRIDPCERRCKYEFIDIYNGEPMLCRVFDGDGRLQRDRLANPKPNQGVSNNVGKPPLLGDIVSTDSSTFGLGLPQTVDSVSGGTQDKFVGDVNLDPAGTSFGTGGSNGFDVQPIFNKPAPPITDPDLLSLLRSFPHEIMNIPTAMIQSALKKNKGFPKNPQAMIKESVPVKNQIVHQDKTILVKPNPQPTSSKEVNKPNSGQSMKTFFNAGDNVVDNNLLELALKDSSLSGLNIAQPLPRPSNKQETLIIPPVKKTKKLQNKPKAFASSGIPGLSAGKPLSVSSEDLLRTIAAEGSRQKESGIPGLTAGNPLSVSSEDLLRTIATEGSRQKETAIPGLSAGNPLTVSSEDLLRTIATDGSRQKESGIPGLTAGNPLSVSSGDLLRTIATEGSRQKEPTKLNAKVSPPKNKAKGVPISIGLFSMWAMS